MKKFITLAALALAAAVPAGAQTLYFGDQVLADGDSYSVSYTAPTSAWGTYTWNSELFVELESAATVNVTITVPSAMSSTDMISICGVKDACYNFNSGKSYEISNTKFAGKWDLDIERKLLASADVTSLTATITVTAGSASWTVYVTYAAQAGIKTISGANGTSVKVNGSNLNYNLPAGTSLAVYAITGAKQMEQKVSGSGSLNIAGLKPGVYLYKAGSMSGKFVVR